MRGRRGGRPLSVVHQRNGYLVSPTHRIDGGSMGSSLRTEAGSAAMVARLFRLIHGDEAPISRSLSFCSIHQVPTNDGPAQVLDYFTDPEVFGGEYAAMREAMRRSIRSFGEEWEAAPLELPGDLGTTVTFLNQTAPAQAILGGTSSFRLDLLANYLSGIGAGALLPPRARGRARRRRGAAVRGGPAGGGPRDARAGGGRAPPRRVVR